MNAPVYAADTSVPVSRSKGELDELLAKHGASKRAFYGDDDAGVAAVVFEMGGRQYRLEIPIPTLDQIPKEEKKWDKMRPVPEEDRRKKHEQACRSRWRSIVLLVRAKLDAIRIGTSTVEREFLADMVLPGGQRVDELTRDSIRESYRLNRPTKLLLGPGEER